MSREEEILKRYKKALQHEISETTSTHFLSLALYHRLKGNFTDEDAVEFRGYRKGLRTALAILERTIGIYDEEQGGIE